MKTGDLILFKGTGLISKTICTFTGRFSHSAKVIDSADCCEEFIKRYKLERNTFYLTESTSISKCHDVFGNKFGGVQLVKLKDKLEKYSGMIWIKSLNKPLTWEMIRKFEENINTHYGKPYDRPFVLAFAGLDLTPIQLEEDFSAWFCSEWCAYNDHSFGLFEGTTNQFKNINEFTPSDLGRDDFELAKGWSYLPAEKIGAHLL